MRVVVREWERVLVYVDGRYELTLEPGRHRVRRRRREVVCFDLRPALVPVPGQELLTADGLSAKVSLLARVRVVDARLAHEAVQDGAADTYAALQVALRAEVASRTLEDLLADRDRLGAAVAEAVAEQLAVLGREVESVAVRDVMVPGELRLAALRVVTARQDGLASLERARGETAALRSLANAAKIANDNPALLTLRTLRAIEAGGATVVLHQGEPGAAQPQ